jgi:hypothetical protein
MANILSSSLDSLLLYDDESSVSFPVTSFKTLPSSLVYTPPSFGLVLLFPTSPSSDSSRFVTPFFISKTPGSSGKPLARCLRLGSVVSTLSGISIALDEVKVPSF